MDKRAVRTLAVGLLCIAGLSASSLLAAPKQESPKPPEAAPGKGAEKAPAGKVEEKSPPAAANVTKKTPPVLKLISEGAEPRTKLRLEPKEGETQKFTGDVSMAMKISMNGRALPTQTLPVTRMTMAVATSDIKADGQFIRTTTMGKAETLPGEGVPEAVRTAMDTMLVQMEGTESREQMTARGEVREAVVKLGKGLEGPLADMIKGTANLTEQASVPMPEGAVGVGAKWAYEVPIETQGIKMTMAMEVELRQFDEKLVTLGLTFVQSAEKQKMAIPALPAGAEVQLEEVVGSGAGTLVMNRSGMPLKTFELESNVRMKMKISAEDEGPMKMDQEMKVKMTLKPIAK